MVTFFILCQYNEVITALVLFTIFVLQTPTGHIHLTTDNRFKKFLFRLFQLRFTSRKFGILIFTFHLSLLYRSNLLLQGLYLTIRAAVLLIYIIEELLHAEHITVIGYSYPPHPITYRLVYEL